MEKGSFKVPFGLLIPFLAIVIIGWLLSHVTVKEFKAMGVFLIVLTLFYFVNAAVRKRIAVT